MPSQIICDVCERDDARQRLARSLPGSLRSPSGALPGGRASGGDEQRHGSRAATSSSEGDRRSRHARTPPTDHEPRTRSHPRQPRRATTERPSSRQPHDRAPRPGGVAAGRGGAGRDGRPDRSGGGGDAPYQPYGHTASRPGPQGVTAGGDAQDPRGGEGAPRPSSRPHPLPPPRPPRPPPRRSWRRWRRHLRPPHHRRPPTTVPPPRTGDAPRARRPSRAGGPSACARRPSRPPPVAAHGILPPGNPSASIAPTPLFETTCSGRRAHCRRRASPRPSRPPTRPGPAKASDR